MEIQSKHRLVDEWRSPSPLRIRFISEPHFISYISEYIIFFNLLSSSQQIQILKCPEQLHLTSVGQVLVHFDVNEGKTNPRVQK